MTLSLKRILFILVLLTTLCETRASTLDFYFTLKRYFEPSSNQNFVELAYLIPGNVVKYEEIGKNQFQSEVLIVVNVQNREKEIIFNHAYLLQSPIYGENPEGLSNLTDLLNIPLDEDSVEFIIQALDLNDSTIYFADNINVNALEDKNEIISDISLVGQLAEGDSNDVFFKNGFLMIPKFINFFPSEINRLSFYVESYQRVAGTRTMLKYFISDENNVVLDKYSNFKKTNASNFDALYGELDISRLPSGNYYLYVELRDENNTMLDRKRMFFQRYNNTAQEEQDNTDYYELKVIKDNFAKKYDLRNITHHLKALRPISDDFEIAAIIGAIKAKDLTVMQNYFYSFWSKRDSKNPEERWMEYAEKLQFVDQEFGNSMIEGHESSRGRVYLQYGKPLERIERVNTQYGAIEIWLYEQIDKQGNVEFLFVENQLFDDEFQLVHSSLNGEIFSREWSQILQSNNF